MHRKSIVPRPPLFIQCSVFRSETAVKERLRFPAVSFSFFSPNLVMNVNRLILKPYIGICKHLPVCRTICRYIASTRTCMVLTPSRRDCRCRARSPLPRTSPRASALGARSLPRASRPRAARFRSTRCARRRGRGRCASVSRGRGLSLFAWPRRSLRFISPDRPVRPTPGRNRRNPGARQRRRSPRSRPARRCGTSNRAARWRWPGTRAAGRSPRPGCT